MYSGFFYRMFAEVNSKQVQFEMALDDLPLALITMSGEVVATFQLGRTCTLITRIFIVYIFFSFGF